MLDFGCGGGAVISSVDCRERVGVETNPATREVARSRGVNCFERLDEVPDRSADIVISNHALEHCLEPATELRQIRRVLTPSGRLLLVLPVDDWRSGRRWRSDDVNQHLYGWTPLLIGNLLAVSGFVPERIDLVHKAWPPRAGTVYRVLPWPLFNLACGLWSRLTNHREMRIIASVSEAKA